MFEYSRHTDSHRCTQLPGFLPSRPKIGIAMMSSYQVERQVGSWGGLPPFLPTLPAQGWAQGLPREGGKEQASPLKLGEGGAGRRELGPSLLSSHCGGHPEGIQRAVVIGRGWEVGGITLLTWGVPLGTFFPSSRPQKSTRAL